MNSIRWIILIVLAGVANWIIPKTNERGLRRETREAIEERQLQLEQHVQELENEWKELDQELKALGTGGKRNPFQQQFDKAGQRIHNVVQQVGQRLPKQQKYQAL